MADQCQNAWIRHNFKSTGQFGNTIVEIVGECFDPSCTVPAAGHIESVSCQWSWPYAHGKKFNGAPFPKRRCRGCAHIRRAGAPEAEIDSQQHLGEAG